MCQTSLFNWNERDFSVACRKWDVNKKDRAATATSAAERWG